MATNAPPPLPPAPVSPKKSNVLLWVLVGVGAFFALIIVGVLAVGLFVVHKARQAGLDPELMKRNPALAATKIMTAMNPNIEFVSMDEAKQEITLRDKKSGDTYTISFDDARQGRFKMKQNGKAVVTINGSGAGGNGNGTVEVKSEDGSVRIGGDAKIPTWVPDYPGSSPQGAFAAQGKDGHRGTFTFKTKDSPDKVAKFYQDEFQSSGLKVTAHVVAASHILVAEDESKTHSITVITGVQGDGTGVTVTYSTNK
jgi:hypothetical protein